MRIWRTRIASFRASLSQKYVKILSLTFSGLESLGKEDLRLWWHLAFESLTIAGLGFCQLPQLFPSLPSPGYLAAVAVTGCFSSVHSTPVRLLPFSKPASVLREGTGVAGV